MGQVVMESEFGSFRYSDGYHDCKITYFIYCDKCGSFGIREYRTLGTWIRSAIGLMIAVLGGAAFWFISDRYNFVFSKKLSSIVEDLVGAVTGLMGIIACLLIAYGLLVAYASYANGTTHSCRRCGSTDISGQNVMNYPEEDWSVIDVPMELAHWHDEYIYA